MKRFIFAAASIATLALAGQTSAQAADVGVSISVGQPGFYGRIDLGNALRPQLVYSQPVVIERGRSYGEPIYLRVPPGQERNWSRYCRNYGACGQQVYFVRDDWYRTTYVPHYRDYYYGDRWNVARRSDRDHDGIPDRYDRHDNRYDGRRDERGPNGDRDHDGVPNKYDRHDNRRGDRRD